MDEPESAKAKGGGRRRSKTAHRTQEQRSARTRRLVCQAVLNTLVDYGWEGVSTTVVARRAKVSRGALVHQYPTRDDMLVAAQKYLVDRWRKGYPFNTGPDYVRLSIEEMIDAMWALFFLDKWFPAGMELLLNTNKDSALAPRLNEVFETWVAERDMAVMTILGIEPGNRRMNELVQLTLATLRGVALYSNYLDDPDYASRHIELWKKLARDAVVEMQHGAASPG